MNQVPSGDERRTDLEVSGEQQSGVQGQVIGVMRIESKDSREGVVVSLQELQTLLFDSFVL